jgi:BirA family transcriptional regulator, biotin operon repressor / biotin---[acetyl-CoA-carboxylase] ligase
MSRVDRVRDSILNALADGRFHSGELLGDSLGISRAAISKHIKSLNDLGLEIYSVTGKGYKLASALTLLDGAKIKKYRLQKQPPTLEVMHVIDSTNAYLKSKLSELENGHACIAEAQTAGRGRHGRSWVSPYGASLYLSLYWSFPGGYQAVSGLSLAVGVAVAQALKDIGVDKVQLKWPNDIYLDNKKLAGVLIEVEGQMGASCECVIGIGLNIDMPTEQGEIDQPWTDIKRGSGVTVDRNHLCAVLLDRLDTCLRQFETTGLSSFKETWSELDLYRDRQIKLLLGQQTIVGSCKGINDIGALLVESNGVLKAYFGGEISVRPA